MGFPVLCTKTYVLQTYCYSYFESQLPLGSTKKINMKSILCWSRHDYASIKEVYLYLDKHVKSGKKGMCCGIYIVLVNGKLAKKRCYGSCSFVWYNNQKTITTTQACLRQQKKATLAQVYKCIFLPENGFKKKAQIQELSVPCTLPTDKVSEK